MPQGSKKKRRFTLQIITACIVSLFLASCGSVSKKIPGPVHPTVWDSAKSIRYVKTIDVVGLGSDDLIKRVLVGSDEQELVKPVAIALRGSTMIIADTGPVVIDAGMVIKDMQERISRVKLGLHDKGATVFYKYDLNTERMTVLRGTGMHFADEISDIYLAEDYTFYVTDVDGRRVLKFSPQGKLLKVYQHPPNIFRPIAVTVDEIAKEVLIADETYSKIVSFDMDKAEPKYGMGERGSGGQGQFRIITDMIPVPDGFLVSDRIELRVQMLDRKGGFIANFGQGIVTFPTALAIDKENRIFVSDKADSTIKIFKAGKLIDTVGSNGYGRGEFRHISDMKVLNNNLYVVDSLNGRIQVFEFVSSSENVALVQ